MLAYRMKLFLKINFINYYVHIYKNISIISSIKLKNSV